MAEYGLQVGEDRIAEATGEQRPEVGAAAMLELVRRAPEITAVVCHNDLLALGALQAAKQSGLPIPQDMSVVGIDDIFTARYSDPPLTTLAIPRVEAGALALQSLFEDDVETLPAAQVTPRLLLRQSTGKARAQDG